MYAQFKTSRFDHGALVSFIDRLDNAGIEFSVTWKKGTKKLESMSDAATLVELKKEGKWFFRQVNKQGFVRLNLLDEVEKKQFLAILAASGFYNKPNYHMGTVLLAIYLLLNVLVFATQNLYFGGFFAVCAVMIVSFLWISYSGAHHNKELKSKFPLIMGGIGYILSAPSSLLTLPLYQSIYQEKLYQQVAPFKPE